MVHPSSKDSIVGIDIIRFLGALIVGFFHLTFWGNAEPNSMAGRALQGAAHFPLLGYVFGQAGIIIEIFFIISGFVITYSARGKTSFEFFKSRVLRLVPAVWVCATITLFTLLYFGRDADGNILYAYLNSMVFFPRSPYIDEVYWTLGIEVSFYVLVFALIAVGLFAHFEKVMLGVGLVSTLACFVAWNVDWPRYFARASQLSLVHYGSSFAAGVFLWLMTYEAPTWGRRVAFLFFLAGTTAEVALTSSHDDLHLRNSTVSTLLFLAFAFLIYASVRWRALAGGSAVMKLIGRAGLITYPFYLLHNIVGNTATRVFVHMGLPDLMALFVALSFVVFISWVVMTWFEPVIRTWLGKAMTVLYAKISRSPAASRQAKPFLGDVGASPREENT